MPVAVVLGARNLGGAVARRLAARGHLAGQGPRGYTPELVLTPSGDRWTP